MSAGKGDKQRPTNKKNFDSNFDKIDWKTQDLKISIKKIKNKIRYVYNKN